MPSHNPFSVVGGGAAGVPISLASATDIFTWTVPFKCMVLRSGVTITTTVDSSNSIVVDFDHRPVSYTHLTLPTTPYV